MKRIVFIIVVLLLSEVTFSQTFTHNENPVGMEHNMLFNANTRSRFQVTQTGSALLSLDYLFDGKFIPSYTSTAPTVSTPTVILIEGLVNWHSQRGAWVGWSTRYWQAKRFKIEGFNVYKENAWKTIADYSTQDYTGGTKFIAKVPAGSYTKLRFTFYEATGQDGRLGVSELFYLHPEAVRPYEGLLNATNDTWSENTNGLYTSKKVGIGTSDTFGYKLAVNGRIGAKEVKVEVNSAWPDFVFEKEYKLPTLTQVESHIKEKGHLKDIPSAAEVKKEGFFLGEMDTKLLQKIEELTLYTIEQEKQLKKQSKSIEKLEALVEKLLENKKQNTTK
ncbi:hypothetical protein [uncultured Tenacibaculum sp.]|uniref:hypothetical protein n=1 Tax=uncultured Tenacibaculum sp. TaxID=174713 RepID=UPI00262B23BC|nr:hypothetical protein [uncultured Tenacibaculum sp.]